MPRENVMVVAHPHWNDLYINPNRIPPEWRDILEYRFPWLMDFVDWYVDQVIELAVAQGFDVTDVYADAARRDIIESTIKDVDPLLFFHADHGGADVLVGQDWDRLIDTANANILSGRVTYTISCLSAKTLGPDVIAKGGLSYIGYADLAWVLIIKWKRPEDSEKIRNWDEASKEGFICGLTRALLVGKTTGETWEELYSTYSELIRYYDTHRDPYKI